MTRMLVKHIVRNSGIIEQCTDEAEQDWVVGSDKLTHQSPLPGQPARLRHSSGLFNGNGSQYIRYTQSDRELLGTCFWVASYQ